MKIRVVKYRSTHTVAMFFESVEEMLSCRDDLLDYHFHFEDYKETSSIWLSENEWEKLSKFTGLEIDKFLY